jgi:hypothetical protein
MQPKNIVDRLWKRTTICEITGCWLLSGVLDKDGYARIFYMGCSMRANRVSAHLYLNLDIKNKKAQANHRPECPNHNCWNPIHLYVGNQYLNVRDQMKAGTHVCQPFCRD